MNLSHFFIKTSFLAFSFLLSYESEAKINQKAFNSITTYFQEGKEWLSPTFGQVFLQTGLAYNLRFYGNFIPAYKKDTFEKRIGYLQEMLKDWHKYHETNFNKINKKIIKKCVESSHEECKNFINLQEQREGVNEDLVLKNVNNLNQLWKEAFEKDKKTTNEKFNPLNIYKILNNNTMRDYINDESEDPTWNLIKLLFPSPAGHLTIERGSEDNFSKNATVETLAILLNYVHDLNNSKNTEENLQKIEKKIKENLKKAKANKDNKKWDESQISHLINTIKQSVHEEKKGTYPLHTTAQILSAFFCEKFNNDDLITLLNFLKELSDEIIKKDNLPKEITLLSLEDIKLQLKNEKISSLDKIYYQSIIHNFTAKTPYPEGDSPVSNGTTCLYIRDKNKIDDKKNFQDCVEVSFRHIFSMILYNPDDGQYDLSSLDSIDSAKNLKKHFEKYGPDKANDGSIESRNSFNTVVADLNPKPEIKNKGSYEKQEDEFVNHIQNKKSTIENIEYNKKAQTKQKQNTNELFPGFMNAIYVFQRILNLELKELEQNASKKTWIEEAFQKIFHTLNPKNHYQITLTEDNNECGKNKTDVCGKLNVKVCEDKDGEIELFSFVAAHNPTHAYIEDIKDSAASATEENKKILDEIRKTKISLDIKNDTEESFLLLNSKNYPAKQDLYKIFPRQIKNNEDWSHFSKKFPYIKKIQNFTYVVNNFFDSYHGNYAVDHIINSVLKEENNNFNMIHYLIRKKLIKKVKKIKLNPDIMKKLSLKISDLKEMSLLESLFFDGSVQLEDLHSVHNLQELKIKNNDTESLLDFSKMGSLKTLIIENSNPKIIGLQALKFLKKLNLSKDTSLDEKMTLEHLDDIKSIEIESNNIKEINISNMKSLDILKLNGDSLVKITLSHLNRIVDLNFFWAPKLEEIALDNLPELLWIFTPDQLKKMTLKNTEKLHTIDIRENLDDINLSEIKSIREILINSKNIKDIKLLQLHRESKKELLRIVLGANSGIEYIDLQEFPKLKYLNINNKIKKIHNIRQGIQVEFNQTKSEIAYDNVSNYIEGEYKLSDFTFFTQPAKY